VTADKLTEEQRAVAGADADARLLVTAGPGTGKTHTLVARIGHLVEEEDVPPGAILALSFSRAAVGELRRRLRATGEDAGRVAPVTFDSFATRVLAAVDPGGPWTEESYDGRIEAALGQMNGFAEELDRIRHVCVDELQDLVGVRMHFVRALLGHLDVGFTLLGDPAQGIYDFSLDDDADLDVDGSPAFYRWVRDRYPGELLSTSLTVNHRARSDIAQEAASLGGRVESDPEGAAYQLLAVLADAPPLTSWGMTRNFSADERTAVLTRNNGQAMWVSRCLNEAGVSHVLQRGATNRSVAPWVARLVNATHAAKLNRGRFERDLTSLGGDVPDADEVWGPLRRVAGEGGFVNLERLVSRMTQGNVPDELHVPRVAPIIVSTVHRAKGLEFDRVIVLEDGWNAPYDEVDARRLFVALSRTISQLVRAELPELHGRLRKHDLVDRWMHTGWKQWQRFGMELRPDDVDLLSPPGGQHVGSSPAEVQRQLSEDVRPGDAIAIELVRERVGAPGAIYRAVHEAGPIAVMADRFERELLQVVKTTKH